MLTKIQLLKILRNHLKLSEKRSATWEQNKTARYFVYIVSAIFVMYMAFISVMLSLIVNSSDDITGYEFMYAIMPFVLVVDFLIRFAFQQTPSQMAKPYSLLPVSIFSCIDCFLLNTLTNTFNIFWFSLFLPFSIMSVLFSEGFIVTIGFLLGLYLLILLNSLWYLLVRSLVNVSILWWMLPAVVYALIFMPWYIGDNAGIETFFESYMHFGEGFSFFNILYYLGMTAAMAVLLIVNRTIQHRLLWTELSRQNDTTVKHVASFSFMDKLGETSEYMKLEVKSIIRNKNVRKTFVFGTCIIIMFSLILSFTDIYDGQIMSNFWCIYCFALYGAMILVKIMCYEGNYIECLMVHKENIIQLLRAKYYIYSILLVMPFLLMLPTVFTGKCTLLMLVAYALFTAGAEYCMFFQMAVFNKQTIPLNTKFIGKGSMETNYLQIVVELGIFIVPVAFISIVTLLLSETVAHIIIMSVGLAFILLHKIWIRNVYSRMMKRRYQNMEGFRSTRE